MNISEFAEYAGVSKAAVSRYFNDGYLSDEKRTLIKKAIEETGYEPSRAAHNVKKRITKLVGVIIPRLSSDSCARITEGISTVLAQNGYEMLLVNTANDHKKELEYLDLFRKQRVDGVVLLAGILTQTHYSLLAKMRIPVIILGQRAYGVSSVSHDDYGASYAVTQRMIDAGAVNFGYIGAIEEDAAVGRERKRGFYDAVKNAGLKVDERLVRIADFSMNSGYERAKYLFKGHTRPDAVFCATDTIAAGAVLYMNEHNIKIPDDVIIGSVGDSKISQVISLTTAHLHYRTSGEEAAKMLMSAIYHSDDIPRSMQLGFELVERNSTKKTYR